MSVFKRRRSRGGKVVESKTYYGILDRKVVNLGKTDKRAAEGELQKRLVEAEKESVGLISPKLIREARAASLLGLLKPHTDNLRSTEKTSKYVALIENRCTRLFRECGWNRLPDITPDSFQRWRDNQRALTGKSLNHYLNAAISFLNGLVDAGKLERNPLQRVGKADGARVRFRRPFTKEELKRLFALNNKRTIVYALAVYTGLRRDELHSLQWGDFQSANGQSWLAVRASTTKNKKDAIIPLIPEIAEKLISVRPKTFKPSDSILGHTMPRMPRFRKDLKLADIEYQDERGYFADFHAFRMTFNMMLQGAGVNFRVVQAMMRHSDPKLTANTYVDTKQLPTFDASSKLEWLGKESKSEEGTEKGTNNLVISSPSVSEIVESSLRPECLQSPEIQSKSQSESPDDAPCQNGEKMEAAGVEPASSSQITSTSTSLAMNIFSAGRLLHCLPAQPSHHIDSPMQAGRSPAPSPGKSRCYPLSGIKVTTLRFI